MARLTAIPARHRMLAWDQAKPRPRSRTAEATPRCARSRNALASRHLTGATANDQAGQKTGSVATVYQHKPAGGRAYRSASPAAFPARATVFGRIIGSYAGSVASISARGRAAMGVPLLRRGQIAVAVVHRDAGLLRQMHPGRQILRPGAR